MFAAGYARVDELLNSKPGTTIPEDDPVKRMPIKDLRQEDGAHELATSPDMEPYLRLLMAQMRGSDTTAEMEDLRQLPLERRYVWRVASVLKWAFADLCLDSTATASF